MATAFENDLRRKFLSAYDAGSCSLEELAAIFMVSVGWAKKISAARTRTGRAERPSYQPGRKPRANAEVQQQVVSWVAAQPDLTLVKIQQKLKAEAAVVLSRGRVGALVNKLGLRFKKNHSTLPNAIPKPTKSGAKSSLQKSTRSSRNA
jgi:transposase